jgi:dolichol-phosphate mannosyltransferase
MNKFKADDVLDQCARADARMEFVTVEKNEAAWERVISKIEPEMFDTDRISLDPVLGPEIACKRYQNWMRDLLKNPKSELMLMVLDGREIAFNVDIVESGVRHGILAANFPEFKNTGYGMALIAGSTEKHKKVRTAVSSNNPQVLRAHQNCGRVVYKEMYVLRKLMPESGGKEVERQPFLSVVTPVYNAPNIVGELHRRLCEELEKLTDRFEIVMVDDCCPRGSGIKCREIAARDPRVKYIALARNFGQHIAISAGLDYAEGDYVFVMDCDLQDPPDEMGRMLEMLRRSGAEICFACRNNRKEGWLKLLESAMFGFVVRRMTDRVFWCRHNIGNFSVITRKAVRAFRRVKEPNRSYAGVLFWLGFRKVFMPIESRERFAGNSGYTFWKSVKLAASIILQQSVKPLLLSAVFAFLASMLAVVSCAVVVWKWLSQGNAPTGWSSIIVVMSVLFAMVFMVLTVMCIYVANLFVEIHRRPLYTVRGTINLRRSGKDCHDGDAVSLQGDGK